MNALMIILAQTKTTAVIEIILLLLVAAVIGYITAWQYYKSVYTKKINILEAEKAELKKEISRMNEENGKLKNRLQDKDNEIKNLSEQIGLLKEKKG